MSLRVNAVLFTLALGIIPIAVDAQTPAGTTSCDSACSADKSGMTGMAGMGMNMGMNMGMDMKAMEAGNLRLDSLVLRMHRATGAAKTTAMEQVLDELLMQRKVMQSHMMHMHGMMPMPHAKPGSADHDGADHETHH
ncbi:MAG: hypothetical protein ABI679_06220 [Gemmatimonadota bacterium]